MNIISYNSGKIGRNQSGQAAILITLILMLIMGIIGLSEAVASDRNKHESLNSQQSIQASYAAETGVNDAVSALRNGIALPLGAQNCTSDITALNSAGYSNIINSSPKVAYTCLTIIGTPGTLQTTVTDSQSSVVRINPSSPTGTITFSWPVGRGNLSNCTTALQFVPPPHWSCPAPVLRVDLFDNVNGGAYSSGNNAALQADTLSFFFLPVMNGAGLNSINFNGAKTTVYNADCPRVSTPLRPTGYCYETLKMTSPATFADGYTRISSIYANAGQVSILGDSGLQFLNSQIEIDSTGIDQNETQRIDVRIPITYNAPSTAPSYAVNAGNFLCKRYILNGPGSSPSPGLSDANPLCGGALKPAIYLYPIHTELVNVKVSYPTGLKTTLPTYNGITGWNVLAQPNGSLTNIADGKNYPYLYWEGNTDSFNFDMSKGFVVPGKDSAAFLNHELTIIGLNKNEIAGFLQFWVPKMKNNRYSLIHFAGSDYTKMAPLTISPKPDSVLRVFMAEEPISMPVKVTTQHFTTFHRTGFTVVEWGGSILN